MDKEQLKEIYNWYYNPGEVLRSIGFYINPYNQWKDVKFQHVFAFDANLNLYVGQYSVYPEHISSLFELQDKREHGLLYPTSSLHKVKHLKKEIENIQLNRFKEVPIIDFHFLEHKNITYLNLRLKKLAQRLYDYGLPAESIIVSKHVDLWAPTLQQILKGRAMKRPDAHWLRKLLDS